MFLYMAIHRRELGFTHPRVFFFEMRFKMRQKRLHLDWQILVCAVLYGSYVRNKDAMGLIHGGIA